MRISPLEPRGAFLELIVQRLSGKMRSGDCDFDAGRGGVQRRLSEKPRGECKQSLIGERFADERDPEGQSVGAEACRYRDRRQVQQIDEIGVVAGASC